MTGITIVTGSPGAGKTTLAQHAAKASQRGLHLPADVFYTFPAHAISPILPEAHEQNAAVIAAVSRAAAAFASRGYEVFLDGIVGPWFLPVVTAELGSTGIPVEYVILRVSLEQAISRATTRTTGSGRLRTGPCAGAGVNVPNLTFPAQEEGPQCPPRELM